MGGSTVVIAADDVGLTIKLSLRRVTVATAFVSPADLRQMEQKSCHLTKSFMHQMAAFTHHLLFSKRCVWQSVLNKLKATSYDDELADINTMCPGVEWGHDPFSSELYQT